MSAFAWLTGLIAVLIGSVILRFVCAYKLMTEYTVDEYLSTPRARTLWLLNMALPLLVVIAIVFAASLTHIWWVTTAAAIFALAVIVKTIWAVWMRLSGRYKAFYQQQQWR